MIIKRWTAILAVVCIIQLIPFSVMAETESGTSNASGVVAQSGINLNDIEITVGGVPIEDFLGAAAGMFSEELEKNMGEAIGELNGIFNEFSEEMSDSLGEIEMILGSMINDTWYLKIPEVSFDAVVKRSTYDNALDLYNAQLSGETGREGRIALNSTEAGLNNIIYIYDESEIIPAIMSSVEAGTFGEKEMVFGLEGYTGTYAVSSVLFLTPSDEPYAMCNMADLSDESRFEAYRDYISEHSMKNYDTPLEYGDQIMTIIFWNEDTDADWMTVVAKEVPMLLE